MKGKLLITGGTGFVAYHLVEEATRQQFEVSVSVRPASSTAHLKSFDLQFIHLNFADEDAMVATLEKGQFEYIIHTAGITKANDEKQYEMVNAIYTQRLASAAVRANIPLRKFVFVSSLAAVGPAVENGLIQNGMKPAPVTAYGRSKLLAEKLLEQIPGLPLITLRPTAVYGPREKDIFIVFKTFKKGLEPYIGSGRQTLSFVYVKDLARLIINTLQTDIVRKAYNISDGNEYDRYALAGFVKKAFGKKTVRIFVPVPLVKSLAYLLELTGFITGKAPALNKEKIKELTASWPCSIEPAKNDFMFTPAYDLEKGVAETIAWYQQNRWL